MMRLGEGWLVLRSAFAPDPDGGSAVVADLDAYVDDATDGIRLPETSWLHRAVGGIEDALAAFFTPADKSVSPFDQPEAANPPETIDPAQFDYEAEDRALAELAR